MPSLFHWLSPCTIPSVVRHCLLRCIGNSVSKFLSQKSSGDNSILTSLSLCRIFQMAQIDRRTMEKGRYYSLQKCVECFWVLSTIFCLRLVVADIGYSILLRWTLEWTPIAVAVACSWAQTLFACSHVSGAGAGAENGAERARKLDERERDLKKYGGAREVAWAGAERWAG